MEQWQWSWTETNDRGGGVLWRIGMVLFFFPILFRSFSSSFLPGIDCHEWSFYLTFWH